MPNNSKNVLNWPGFLWWCFFNIFLPLLPIALRLFFNAITIRHISIIENMELLYYTLVICILHFNVYTNVSLSKKKALSQRFHTICVFLLGIFDVIMVITIYAEQASESIRFWCIFFAVSAAISLFFAKLITEYQEKEGVR
jgi:hypothetical protein